MNTGQKTLKPDRRPRRSLQALSLGLTLCLVSAEHGAAAEPIKPVPITIEVNEAKAELGRRLFHDPRLSKNDTISCATCHDLSAGGDDGQVVSTGIEGRVGLVNSPTVFNSAFNFKQFWDGRAHTLKDQIDGPLQSRIEMESIWPDVVTKLFQDEDYPRHVPGDLSQRYRDHFSREHQRSYCRVHALSDHAQQSFRPVAQR